MGRVGVVRNLDVQIVFPKKFCVGKAHSAQSTVGREILYLEKNHKIQKEWLESRTLIAKWKSKFWSTKQEHPYWEQKKKKDTPGIEKYDKESLWIHFRKEMNHLLKSP